MEQIFFYCGVVGLTVLVLQTVLMLFSGADGDVDAQADIDPDVDTAGVEHAQDVADAGDTFIKVLSFKSIVAFVTFFGWTGLACLDNGVSQTWSILAASGAGLGSMYVVAWMMAALARLKSEGNEDLRNAIGNTGKVYLRIPGGQVGFGKVTVTVQGRQITRKAVTKGEEIPTGAVVKVTALSGVDTLEVVSAANE